MADTVTHYIAAKRVVDLHKEFSPDFTDGFLLGAQGPDIFFFGTSAESFALGDSFHDSAPKMLFEMDSNKLGTFSEKYRGYYYGVLMHYFVDRIIHQYVGYRRRNFPKQYSHTLTETSIDMIMCEREFGYKISKFPFGDIYQYDKELAVAVYEFWQKRSDSNILTQEHVDYCLKKFYSMTKRFLKPNFLFVALVKKMEKEKGSLLCHLKLKENYDLSVMNDQKAVWQGRDEDFTLSVEDMLIKSVRDFEKEYQKINGKEPYEFIHTEEFSCNK